MQHNLQYKIAPFEKIVSILSYCSMGIVGLILAIIAHCTKQKIRYFLMYNITQSIVIAIILAIFKFFLNIILSVIAKIPFLDFLCAIFNYIFSTKIIKIAFLSFNLIELVVFLLIIYICAGILLNRIFYIPFLTNLIQSSMKNYSK